jgi:hypothetical protein
MRSSPIVFPISCAPVWLAHQSSPSDGAPDRSSLAEEGIPEFARLTGEPSASPPTLFLLEATLRYKARFGSREIYIKFALATLISQSTSVTKPEVDDLPFAAGGTEIEKVSPFLL